MIKSRLLTLAYGLERLRLSKKRTFDMCTWSGKTLCGTSACAIGYGARMKKLRKLGLSLCRPSLGSGLVPIFMHYKDWRAVEKFFGLTSDEAYFLFGMGELVVSPRYIAARILRFVENHGKQTM